MKKRELNLLLVLAALLSAVGYAFFIYMPMREEIAGLHDEVAAKTDERDDAISRIVKWGVLSSQFPGDMKAAAMANLANEFDGAGFIRRIRDAIPSAGNIGFSFPAETAPAEEPKAGLTEIHTVDLEFTAPAGTLNALFDVLESLELENRVVGIRYTALGTALEVRMLIEALTEIQEESSFTLSGWR